MNHFDHQPSQEELVLRDQIERATDNLTPARGYSLTVGNLALRQSFLRQLEQTFNRSLKQTGGEPREGHADVTLRFDNEALYPHTISTPLHYPDSIRANLFHSKQLQGYIPILSQPDNHQKVNQFYQPDFSPRQAMELLEITQPPSLEPPAYRLWLSNLVDRGTEWELDERLELPIGITDASISTLILRNRIRIDTGTTHAVRSIEQRTVTKHPSSNEHSVSRTVMEVGGSDGDASLSVWNEYGSKNPDDPFEPEVVYIEKIPLDPTDAFKSLHQLTSEALESRQSGL